MLQEKSFIQWRRFVSKYGSSSASDFIAGFPFVLLKYFQQRRFVISKHSTINVYWVTLSLYILYTTIFCFFEIKLYPLGLSGDYVQIVSQIRTKGYKVTSKLIWEDGIYYICINECGSGLQIQISLTRSIKCSLQLQNGLFYVCRIRANSAWTLVMHKSSKRWSNFHFIYYIIY